MRNIILPQIVSLGVYDAQIALKNKAVSPNRKTTMFEIELPMGDGGISYVDNSTHTISENMLICVKPGQIRHTRLPFKCYFIHMIVNEGKIFDILSSLPNYIELRDRSEFLEVFMMLCKYYDEKFEKNEIMLQSLILKLVYLLEAKNTAVKKMHTPKSNNHVVIENTISYINENLCSSLTLENLSQMAGFTPVYFHKLFKKSTGKTLREYIEEQRIKKSVSLLLSSDINLTEIAYESGFSSQSYFSYSFKKRMGVTPREYAKRILSKYEE